MVLSSITNKKYKNNKISKKLFNNIHKHYNNLNTTLKRDVGIIVASLDYLTNILDNLDEPKIIEEKKSKMLSEMATMDELTELYLRDIFDVILSKEINESKRNDKIVSLMIIDIDDFKKVNDEHGHQKGDEVLKCIGQLLNDNVREMDTAARYGGEELVIIMPNTTLKQAYRIADRIRADISKLEFDSFSIKVSIGVSQTDENINSTKKLIKTADEALYEAKNSGKNKVVRYNNG
jgi:diguanylate cyclase (GGDEF)-like protein